MSDRSSLLTRNPKYRFRVTDIRSYHTCEKMFHLITLITSKFDIEYCTQTLQFSSSIHKINIIDIRCYSVWTIWTTSLHDILRYKKCGTFYFWLNGHEFIINITSYDDSSDITHCIKAFIIKPSSSNHFIKIPQTAPI